MPIQMINDEIQFSHRPTKGQDLTWLANKILALAKMAAAEAGYRTDPGQFSDPTDEREAYLTGDDSGDYLGCSIDGLTGLRPWMAHEGPDLSETGGFSLGDIADLDAAINSFAAGLEMGQFDRGYGMATYYADEAKYGALADLSDKYRAWLQESHPTISEIIEMIGI